MPEIGDLLRDALPAMHGFDEDDVRRRVVRRRRGRRVVGGLVALAAIISAVGVYALANDDSGEPVVADRPTTTVDGWSAYGATSIAIADDQVWVGGDGFVSLGDGSSRIDVPAVVTRLDVEDGVLWASGTDWVSAIDVSSKKSVGMWSGDGLGDVEPLPRGEALLTLTLADEVAVVRTTAEGLEEIERIAVGDQPSEIVETTSHEIWIRNDGDGTIQLVDWGAGGVADTLDWDGELFGPALDGTIWTTDGTRVVSLDPSILRTGALSAAIGERYAGTARMVQETSFGVFVGGPGGITLHTPAEAQPEVITTDVPDAMAASGGQIAYVVGGEVHTAMVSGAQGADPEAWRTEPRQVAARYLSDELKWPDVIIDRDEGDDMTRTVYATSSGVSRDAEITLSVFEGEWDVTFVWTFGPTPSDTGVTIDLGNGRDLVRYSYAEPGLAAELTVRYGEASTTRTAPVGEAPRWAGDLGWRADTAGFVEILYRNEDGVAVEAFARRLPEGPFSVD